MTDREGTLIARALATFAAAGAERLEPGYLQPAELLLDLYGEDIRSRAYTTSDPVLGEQVLRPDFTVPVVREYMRGERGPARYCYAGPVWRRQDYGSNRPREFWQVGFEIFGTSASTQDDAEVFSLIADLLPNGAYKAVIGDLDIAKTAVRTLPISAARRSALMRHIWRPNRFARLLDRYAGNGAFACDQLPLAELAAPSEVSGVRSAREIDERLAALREEAAQEPLSQQDLARLTSLMSLKGSPEACLQGLELLTKGISAFDPVVEGFADRLAALKSRGVDLSALVFDAAFGRETMEYYQGFAFGFLAEDGALVASGGRYDALTEKLSPDGIGASAVGGVIRPAAVLGVGGMG